MSGGVRISLTGQLLGSPQPKQSRFGRSYLQFNLAVDPDSPGVTARADGRPVEVWVRLHSVQVAEQLHEGARVSLTGWLELESQPGHDTARGARLTMVARSCTLLDGPIDQGEAL